MEILISILVGFAIMECYAWAEPFSKWLLERAVRRVDISDRERRREEWTADLEAMPNTMLKLIFSLQSFRASTVKIINAEIQEAAWEKVENALEDALITRQKLVRSIARMRSSYEGLRHSEENLEQTILSLVKLATSLATESTEIASPIAVAINRFESSCGIRIGETEFNSALRNHSTELMRIKVEKVEGLFDAALSKIDRAKASIERRIVSPDDVGAVVELRADLAEICRLLGGEEDFEPIRERIKIFTEISDAIESGRD
jgi:hypothetical protein